LVPYIRQWLKALDVKPKIFIEPFAGGGIVSLTVAFEDLAGHVIMVELDAAVAALWKTLLSDDNDWIAQRVLEFNVTPESVRKELAKPRREAKQLAFQTLLRNRTFHGGILANGSSILKYGENGRGIRSRWYPQTLFRRIQNIKTVRSKITFLAGNGIKILAAHAAHKGDAFFIDPPYTAAGKRAGSRLYTHSELDHEDLFRRVERIEGPFLMTYDNAEEVAQMASRHSFSTTTVPMMNTHHATMRELLISRDLSWL
jgi:DNA adenine methylase